MGEERREKRPKNNIYNKFTVSRHVDDPRVSKVQHEKSRKKIKHEKSAMVHHKKGAISKECHKKKYAI